jgi:diguanylate cyclase (GGDEF)-like protein
MDLSQGTLIAILAAVLIADVLVVVVALAWTQLQKRRQRATWSTPSTVTSNLVTADPRSGAVMGGATGSGIGVGSGGASGLGGVVGGSPSAGFGGSPSAGFGGVPNAGFGSGPNAAFGGRTPVAATPAPMPATPAPAPVPTVSDPNLDLLTGLLMQSAWTRIVGDEEARIRRYHRPATIVIIEVEGLQRLATRLGPNSVDRIVPAIADTIRRGARESDHVARLASGRFAVLLPETDDVLAINYIERIRRACDLWLESGAVALRLAIGWATSTTDGSLVDAEALATDRMYTELRRAVRTATPPPNGPTATDGGGFEAERAFGA